MVDAARDAVEVVVFDVEVEVDQTPVLEESVDSQDGAGVAGLVTKKYQVASAHGRSQVRLWIVAVQLDDVVPVVLVDLRSLRGLASEELWQCVSLQLMDTIDIEPTGT